MNFSLKSIACVFIWLSLVLALLMWVRTEAAAGNTFSSRSVSEVLKLANLAFTVCVVSFAVGSFPDRFWMSTAIVAFILVFTQLYGLLPTGVIQTSLGNTILTSLATQPVGNKVWVAEHSSEIAALMLFSLVPVVSFSCGWLAVWKSNSRSNT